MNKTREVRLLCFDELVSHLSTVHERELLLQRILSKTDAIFKEKGETLPKETLIAYIQAASDRLNTFNCYVERVKIIRKQLKLQ